MNNNALTEYSYSDQGCTRGRNVAGFNTDRVRIELGLGDVVLEKAKRGLRDWQGFSTDWVRLCWPYKKIVTGAVVAILAHHYTLYSLNAARIVYVIDAPKRFGFALGSLMRHVLRGEVSFLVYQEADGKVYYELTSISRPGHWLSWLFYPLTRQLQHRFARDSLHAFLESMLARNSRPPGPAPPAESAS